LLAELLRQGNAAGILEAYLRYLFQADTDVTYAKFTEVIASTRTIDLESDAMSIAEELIQEGMEKGIGKGIEKGNLIGKIQFAQQALRLPVTSSAQLEQQAIPELKRLLHKLEEQFRRGFE
jgi:hypothetical protein